MKNILILVAIILLIAAGAAFYLYNKDSIDTYVKEKQAEDTLDTTNTDPDSNTTLPTDDDQTNNNLDNNNLDSTQGDSNSIGRSAEGNSISAYHFGNGPDEIVLIGGVHGGYSWNTALLGFEIIDWLESNPSVIPSNLTVTVIPVLNPDGLKKVTGNTGEFTTGDVNDSEAVRVAGRFNGNDVDLNRNFDCEWKSVSTWKDRNVSGGSEPFSEPETRALRSYVTSNDPTAVVVWYSSAGEVNASSCGGGIADETLTLANLFANASNYPVEDFNYYEINGDMANWMAGLNIPAISVILSSHNNTEWSKNRAGIEAVLNHYAN